MVDEGSRPEKAPTAPYLPFATFLTALGALEQGVPRKIDKGLWRSQSGGTQTQLMSTLRFLGAVDAAGATQQCLDELIAAQGDERKRVFRRMLTDAYPAVVGLVPQNASLKALEDAIATLGLSGDTMRKGVAFFIRAAEWAELPVSPHWKAATKRGPRRVAGATTRRARPAKRANGGAGQSDRGESGNNGSTTSDVAALRTRYIEMLMKKADEEGADAGLLDRIEALLGFEPRSTSA